MLDRLERNQPTTNRASLCGNLTHLDMHLKSEETGNKHDNACNVYGKVDYPKCSICGVCLHLMANRYQTLEWTSFFDYHNDTFFGLARADAGLKKPKVKTGIIPHFLKIYKIQGLLIG